ncbi:MAG: hypothetical protein KDA22_11065, partial [Phycisphaerales bacterium]|nr:hypothetical protein [Phycisphaerales bacterium]
KLRLVVDGDDRVGAERRFGATVTLRFTTAVDRETGGFSRYLQNDVWARVGNSYRPMNHRDQLQKDIEAALRERFDIETIGFFEALAPPLPVVEGGEDGWLEKPLAYVVLKARDPSVDRVPAVTMDLLFNDTLGPVTLPVASNAPLIDASGTPDRRPVRNLEVVQTVDLREIDNPDQDRAVTLEIQAKGQGVLPELDDLLAGVRTALPGYEVAAGGIEARPVGVVQNDADWLATRFVASPARETTEYTKPDENGIYRLTTERSWLVTFAPTGAAVGDAFAFPTLAAGLDGTLTSRHYTDMDIVPVATASVAVHPSPWSNRNLLVLGGLAAVAVVGAVLFLRRRRTAGAADEAMALPERITPLSVVAALRRIERDPAHALDASERQSLDREIAVIEAKYFAPDGDVPAGNGQSGAELRTVLERWMRGAGAAGSR